MQKYSLRLLIALLYGSFLWGCGSGGGFNGKSVDPVAVLAHNLSHGIGRTPLDSALIRDPKYAAMIVAARKGIEIERLVGKEGQQKEAQAQIADLEHAGLLISRGRRAYATFPILIGKERDEYCRLLSLTAREAYDSLIPKIRLIIEELDQRDWRQWAYHFISSQLFDSQFAWNLMMERKLVPPLSTPIAWVIYPQHPFKSGTNYYPNNELRDYWLMVSWTPEGKKPIEEIGGRWETVYVSALSGRAMNEVAALWLRDLGLVNDRGRVLVPVVRKEDGLYVVLRQTAEYYINLLATRLPQKKIAALINKDVSFAWAVAYHDIYWELLRLMLERGEFVRPKALAPCPKGHPRCNLAGVCAVVAAYPPFMEQIRKAFKH